MTCVHDSSLLNYIWPDLYNGSDFVSLLRSFLFKNMFDLAHNGPMKSDLVALLAWRLPNDNYSATPQQSQVLVSVRAPYAVSMIL